MATEQDKRPQGGNAVMQLLQFAGSRRWLAFAGSALAAVNGILTVVPLVLVWFVLRDFVAVAPHFEEATDATLWAWLAFGAAVLGALCYFAGLMLTHTAAFRVAANMRKACLAHVAKVPLGYFDANASGRLRRIIDGCAGQTEDVIAHKMPDFIASITAPVAYLVAMFLFDWVMGLVCLIPVAVSLFAMWWMMGRDVPEGGRYFMQRYQEALNRMSTAATEYVRGIPVVKVFQQTVHSFRAFHAAIVDYRDMATNYVNFCRLPQVVQLHSHQRHLRGARAGGHFAGGGRGRLRPLPHRLLVLRHLLGLHHHGDEQGDVLLRGAHDGRGLHAPGERDSGRGAHGRGAPKGPRRTRRALRWRFENVTFAYPGSARPALRDVSLTVPAGATVALVGPSGGGKSTLASLVPRFWDPQEGVVAVGGADVRRIPAAELMDTVAFVFQNDRLFKGTLADNIRMGRPDASDEDVAAAARAAQCDDIIAKFPEGLATRVGADGVYLSGGECQRIALARAILKDAPVVVLDEATAFADPENEALIQQALGRLAAGKTVLMIAHRLSTVVDADLIAVVDDGAIVERGTHDELLARGGTYARLWKNYCQAAQWKIAGGSAHAA